MRRQGRRDQVHVDNFSELIWKPRRINTLGIFLHNDKSTMCMRIGVRYAYIHFSISRQSLYSHHGRSKPCGWWWATSWMRCGVQFSMGHHVAPSGRIHGPWTVPHPHQLATSRRRPVRMHCHRAWNGGFDGHVVFLQLGGGPTGGGVQTKRKWVPNSGLLVSPVSTKRAKHAWRNQISLRNHEHLDNDCQ